MKKLIIIGPIIISNFAFSQNDTSLNLKNFEIPTLPGFILLDQAPSTIVRPNNTKALVISVLNSFTESSSLPKNYAVEFTPFWFFKHPNMNVLKYSGYKNKKQRPFSSIKMASISVAYINQIDSNSINPINNISAGFRTNILTIRTKGNLKAIANANSIAVSQLRKIDDIIVNRIGPADPINPEGYRQKHLALLNFLQDSLKNTISQELLRKPIFAIDFASAYNTFFFNNNFSTQRLGRYGVWLTLNFSKKITQNNSCYLNIYAISRYLKDGTNKNAIGEYIFQNFYDFGGKIELELNKFSIGYEYIYRSNNTIETYRSSGMMKYRISDNLLLTGAFGKNFGNTNNLVSMLGIDFGFETSNEKAKIN